MSNILPSPSSPSSLSLSYRELSSAQIVVETTASSELQNKLFETPSFFLEKAGGVDLMKADDSQVFYHAVSTSDMKTVQLLLDEKADIDFSVKSRERGETLLHLAVANADTRMLALLMKLGINIDSPDALGVSPLHFAVIKGFPDIVEQLIDAKAELDSKDIAGDSALHSAVEQGFESIVIALMGAGADTNARNQYDGETILHYAVRKGNVDIVKCLVNAKVDLVVDNNDGETAVQLAILLGSDDIVQELEKRVN